MIHSVVAEESVVDVTPTEDVTIVLVSSEDVEREVSSVAGFVSDDLIRRLRSEDQVPECRNKDNGY